MTHCITICSNTFFFCQPWVLMFTQGLFVYFFLSPSTSCCSGKNKWPKTDDQSVTASRCHRSLHVNSYFDRIIFDNTNAVAPSGGCGLFTQNFVYLCTGCSELVFSCGAGLWVLRGRVENPQVVSKIL